MRPPNEIRANPRLKLVTTGDDGFAAAYNHYGVVHHLIVSWGGGWEHASVSVMGDSTITPTWGAMDCVARIVWADGEVPMQLHVHGANKVNDHPGCLHLWHKAGQPTELPPKAYV